MNKNLKTLLLFVVTIILFMCILITYYNDLTSLMIIFIVLTVVSFMSLIYLVFYKKNIKSNYRRKINRIQKIYSSKIVKMNTKYEIKNNNLVCAKKIEDLFELSEEFKQPIVYIEEEGASIYLLEYGEDILYYILKEEEEKESKFEKEIKEIKERRKEQKESERDILSKINKTTIIQLKNNKFYKIKPIKK